MICVVALGCCVCAGLVAKYQADSGNSFSFPSRSKAYGAPPKTYADYNRDAPAEDYSRDGPNYAAESSPRDDWPASPAADEEFAYGAEPARETPAHPKDDYDVDMDMDMSDDESAYAKI